MSFHLPNFGIVLCVLALASQPADSMDRPEEVARFRMQEIETGLGVGYGVLLVDVNNDGRPDIVVADQTRIFWYENPTWRRRTILEGRSKPDNVCIAAHDIDGDGKLDLALGADWKPANTRDGGTLQWLRQGKSVDDPWTLIPMGTEPTLHRIRFADLDGDGKPELIAVPLMGRNSSREKNWMDGLPVRVLAYKIPKDPTRDRWLPEILSETLHVVHNFWPIASPQGKRHDLLAASYEGVTRISRDVAGRWLHERLGEGNQADPKANLGASEIKQGSLKNGVPFIATIEPWHGHQVVSYMPPTEPGRLWQRHVVDEKLRWGHAVWCVDLDGDGADEIIIGVRDNLSKNAGERCGVRIYKAEDGNGATWTRQLIDQGGVAVEDLAAADLNGDGRVDIVAVGRQTHNIRIYWNQGLKQQ